MVSRDHVEDPAVDQEPACQRERLVPPSVEVVPQEPAWLGEQFEGHAPGGQQVRCPSQVADAEQYVELGDVLRERLVGRQARFLRQGQCAGEPVGAAQYVLRDPAEQVQQCSAARGGLPYALGPRHEGQCLLPLLQLPQCLDAAGHGGHGGQRQSLPPECGAHAGQGRPVLLGGRRRHHQGGGLVDRLWVEALGGAAHEPFGRRPGRPVVAAAEGGLAGPEYGEVAGVLLLDEADGSHVPPQHSAAFEVGVQRSCGGRQFRHGAVAVDQEAGVGDPVGEVGLRVRLFEERGRGWVLWGGSGVGRGPGRARGARPVLRASRPSARPQCFHRGRGQVAALHGAQPFADGVCQEWYAECPAACRGGGVPAGQFVEDALVDEGADAGGDGLGGQSRRRRDQGLGESAERPQDAQRRGHRSAGFFQGPQRRDVPVVVRQQWHGRTGAEEGVAVGRADRVLCRPFDEEGVQCPGDAAAQLVDPAHQVGVGCGPQALRHHGGGVLQAEAWQGDRVCRPVVGEPVHGVGGAGGRGCAVRCGVADSREDQPGAGRSPFEVGLVEQGEGFGVGVVGVVDEYDRGGRSSQSGGECFGHRCPVAALRGGQRFRGRLVRGPAFRRGGPVFLQGHDQSQCQQLGMFVVTGDACDRQDRDPFRAQSLGGGVREHAASDAPFAADEHQAWPGRIAEAAVGLVRLGCSAEQVLARSVEPCGRAAEDQLGVCPSSHFLHRNLRRITYRAGGARLGPTRRTGPGPAPAIMANSA